MTANQVSDAAADAASTAYHNALIASEQITERQAMKNAVAAAFNAQPGLGGPPPTDPV